MTNVTTMNDNFLENVISLMQRDESQDAPAESLKWIKNAFRVNGPKKVGIIERITAYLNIELSGLKPAIGERSSAPTAIKQMVFEAEGISIDLRVKKVGKTFEVFGQVIADDFENCRVSLIGDKEFTSETDEFAGFNFPLVASGSYSFSVNNGKREIYIEDIKVL